MTRHSVIVRADARPDAGGGHMGRCLNVARALAPECDVAFALGAGAAPQWSGRLCEAGFAVTEDVPHRVTDIVVLDGYDISARDVAEWRPHCGTVVMIEDLGRCFAGVDLFICCAGPPPQAMRTLAGPRYALLDASYAKPTTAGGDSILVACGLRDSANVTGLYLDALSRCGTREAVTVTLGAAAPYRAAVERQARALSAQLIIDAPEMIALYDGAGLVLGVGGVSLFERAARGRASVTVVAADNQRHSAEDMAGHGGTRLAGNARTIDPTALTAVVETLLADRQARATMAIRARQTVDGLGAGRTAREILALAAQSPRRALATNC